MSREAAAVARRAAEIIQQRGKCTGSFFDDEGRVCLWGAITEALVEQGAPRFGIAIYEFEKKMRKAGALDLIPRAPAEACEGWAGAEWNDLPDTDERDVAKVLLQVADRLEVSS